MSSVAHASTSPDLAPDFADFYAEWFPRNVAHVRLKYQLGREDAEDIVQNAFLAFWRAHPTLTECGTPAVYFRACVTNETKEFLHRRLFTDSLDAPLFDEGETTLAEACNLSASALGTEDQALFNVEMAEMASLVASFTPLWRFVFLRTVAGYSLAEIHHELVTRQGYTSTVKALQHVLGFARQALRQQQQVQKLHPRPVPPPVGPWSARYAACVRCGGTQFRFAAHGLCQQCYKHLSWHANHGKPTGRRYKTQWAEAYPSCQGCGTSDRPHCAKGYCRPCYRERFDTPRRSPRHQSQYLR